MGRPLSFKRNPSQVQKIGFLGHLGRFDKSDFSQKISWAPGHGLRNPIFPKNRISWAPWARFEKSDFSQKISWAPRHGLRNPIFHKNRISWAPDFFFIFLARLGTV
jgi:hypothetical protein